MPETQAKRHPIKKNNPLVRKLEVLFLYTGPMPEVDAIVDHVEALTSASQHHVRRINMISHLPPRLNLNRFDVIVIHYTIAISLASSLCADSFERLSEADAMKVLYIQDEYRHVDATVEAIRELGIDVLFTCVPVPEIEKVYPSEKLPDVRKENVLTGYVNQYALDNGPPKPLTDRPIDVGYRSRRVPAWLGQLGREKWMIGEQFLNDAAAYDLRCDISVSEKDRLYGAHWDQFLGNCRAVLGVESGASVFDFTGEIQSNVAAAEAANPELTFDELEESYFPNAEGKIRLNQISPRCFEAALRGTLMILYEGEYSGRLKPGRHYVELKKDHSNMAEVVAVLQDETQAQAIADRAWKEVACAAENSYESFTDFTDTIINEEWQQRPKRTVTPYTDQEFTRDSVRSLKAKLIFLKCYLGWRIPLLRKASQFFRELKN